MESYTLDIPAHLDDGAWYHGSPERLDTLLVGSTITRSRAIAEGFSHKPTCLGISIEERAGEPTRLSVCENGTHHGYLYVVAEPVAEDDVYVHPQSSFDSNEGPLEWLINRPLCVRFIAEVPIAPADCTHCTRRKP